MKRPVRRTITVTITETWIWVWQPEPAVAAEQDAQGMEYKVYRRQRTVSESMTEATDALHAQPQPITSIEQKGLNV